MRTNKSRQEKQSLRALLALSIIPRLGIQRLRDVLKKCEDPAAIFGYSKTKLRSYEGIGEASALAVLSFKDWDKVDEIIRQTEKAGAQIITYSDSEYPELLKQIYDPPLLFWMKGNPEALSKKGVAVIGTRNPTSYGKKMASKFSGELATQGLCIFSGLAYGIDALAHQAAVESGATTVAVLGSGIDNLYPRSHAGIANQIVKSGGAVITEFPLGTNPDAGNFPVRNRIVSGLSLGVVVIESGLEGGSMITADLALDQNREVFAIPHSIENLSGAGGNYLIKKGAAKLVQTTDDILVELPVEYTAGDSVSAEHRSNKNWRENELDETEVRICEQLEEKAWQVDDLADKLDIGISPLLVYLLQLEMKDIIMQRVGKVFELK